MSLASGVLPAIYSNVAGEVIAGVIEELYTFGAVASCRLIVRGNNDVYAVRTAAGARFVARLSHRRARGPANVAYETHLLAHLHARGAPVAAAVADAEGLLWRQLNAFEGERPFAVFEHVAGRPAGPEPEAATAQGEALARIHRDAVDHDGVPSHYSYDLDETLRRPMRRLAQVSYLPPDARARIEAVAAQTEARLAPLLDGLDWRVCHGDPLGVNAHVRAREDGALAATYFDFENAGPAWVAHDLAIYFERIARRRNEVEFDDAQLRQWAAFVEGYERIRTIERADYAAVAAFAPVRRLWWPADFASRLAEWGSSNLQPPWVAMQVEAAARWADAQTPAV